VSDPYEPPAAPDLTIKTTEEEPLDSACKVIEKLEFYGYLKPPVEAEEHVELSEM
jgi:adenylylsulfate kinase-like enzyme